MAAATVTHQPDLLQLRNQPQASLRQPSLTNSSSRAPNLAMATLRQYSNAIRNKTRGQKSFRTPSSGKERQDSNEEKKSKRFDKSYSSQNEKLKSTQSTQPNRDITTISTMPAKPKRFLKNKRYSSCKPEHNNCELKVVNKQSSDTQETQLQPPTLPLPVDSTHVPLTTQPHLKCSISVDSGRGDDISSSCESSVVNEQGQVQTPNTTSSYPQLLDSISSENENSPGEDDVFMDALSNLGSDSEDDDEFVTPLASRSPSLSRLSPSHALNDTSSLTSLLTIENPDPSTLTDIINKRLQEYDTGILQDDPIPVPPSHIPKSICDSPTPVLPRISSNDSGMYEGQSNEESSLGPLSSLGTCPSHENSLEISFFIGNNDQTLDSIPQIEIEDKKADTHSQHESESQIQKESFNETGITTLNQLPDLLNVPPSTSKSCNTSFDSTDLVLSRSSDSGITSSPTSSSPSPSHSQSPNPEHKDSSCVSMSHDKLVTSLRNPRLASESDIMSLLSSQKDEPSSSVLKQRQPYSTLKPDDESKQHQSMQNSSSTPDMLVDTTSSIEHGIHSLSFHPLNSTWVLWYDKLTTKRPQFANYAASLERLAVMNSVEEFWGVYNNLLQPSELEQNANYHFFKKGIKPLWEDKANKHGGKWVFTFKSNSHLLDKTWMEILMALVGEHVEKSHLINGAVLSRRKKGDRIAVWTTDKKNKPGNLHICKQLVQVLSLACDIEETKYSEFVHKLAEDKEGVNMVYMHHDDSLRSKTSYQNEAHLTLRKNLQFVLDDQ